MKKKHSISTRMTITFTIVLLAILLACWVANNVFLERFYVMHKQEALIDAYNRLNEASEEARLTNADFVQELSRVCESNNISLFVMGSNGQVKLYSMKDYDTMKERLYNYLFELFQNSEGGTILKENDFYTIRRNTDERMRAEYLEIVGSLSGGESLIARSPIDPIRESVMLANRFLLYVGVVVLIVGAGMIYYLSVRLARPLLELARVSERMTNLDFDVKFTGSNDREIAFLGDHMNQLSETLEKTISELKTANNELQRDIEWREKQDEMRKEFLSNVSHELKTPIALIQGYAEGLQECINDDAESREFYCDVIMDEAAKMNKMVKNLLTLNELEFGNETVTMERFDLASMIRNMLQASKILFEQKEVQLVYDVMEPVYVWGNEFKLEEVMNNYISNALNHVANEKIIKITLQRGGGKVRVGVFNTGKPIPEEDVDRIWDKFYKVDKARTREYGGSGVGLSIVKAIMESLHQPYGVVNYENGVEFWLELETAKE